MTVEHPDKLEENSRRWQPPATVLFVSSGRTTVLAALRAVWSAGEVTPDKAFQDKTLSVHGMRYVITSKLNSYTPSPLKPLLIYNKDLVRTAENAGKSALDKELKRKEVGDNVPACEPVKLLTLIAADGGCVEARRRGYDVKKTLASATPAPSEA
ncbi:hypothetical protein KCP75_22385 [Salmonella enterica subsp. enterica]|nr:hypothetical protein KCP75_22385 [Salmonella enterica subsp. enterica]